MRTDYTCCPEETHMESHRLYVGNIDHSMTEEDLREVFSRFGTLTDVKIIRDKGFGFVAYATLEEAEEARKTMAGKEFEGRTLRVEDARPIYQNTR
jgi:RNA recognition motif-containing protein